MGKIDARTLSPEEQFELRKQVVRLRKRGMTNKDVALIVGICHTHVSTIWQMYQRGGDDALKPNARGRKHGEMRTLTVDQEERIKKWLLTKTPMQLKLPFLLWSREAIHFAVRQKLRTDLELRTISDYLKRWGVIMPQRPRGHVDDMQVMITRANRERAEINWFSVEVVAGDFRDVQGCNNGCGNIKMISAINNQGKVRFMLFKADVTRPVFTKFASRLANDAGGKVVLVLSGDEWNHRTYINWKDPKGLVELDYLPWSIMVKPRPK